MKLLLAMLAAGFMGAAPLMAQSAAEPRTSGKVVVLGEKAEGEECPEGIVNEGEDLDKALEDVLKEKDLPPEIRDAIKKMLDEHKKVAKDKKPEGDTDETTEETLPDGTKVVRRIVHKTSSGEKIDDSDLPKEAQEALKKLRQELKQMKDELDKKIAEDLGDGDGDATEEIDKVLPDGTRIKIVKSVSRKTSGGEAPKAPEPKKEDKPNKQ